MLAAFIDPCKEPSTSALLGNTACTTSVDFEAIIRAIHSSLLLGLSSSLAEPSDSWQAFAFIIVV